MKIARGILGVVVGLIVAFLIVQAAEMLTHRLYPFPPGADMQDMATIKKFVATLPMTAFLLVLTGWLVGTLLGSFVAAKIGHSRIPAYVLSVLLLAAGVANAFMIPQPAWFTLASIVIFSFVPFAGIALAKPAQPQPQPPAPLPS